MAKHASWVCDVVEADIFQRNSINSVNKPDSESCDTVAIILRSDPSTGCAPPGIWMDTQVQDDYKRVQTFTASSSRK